MNFFNTLSKTIAAKQPIAMPAKSGFFNNIAKNVAKAKPAMPVQSNSAFFNTIAKNIAASKPIPAQTKKSFLDTIRQGKKLPDVIQKALAIKAASKPQKAIKKPLINAKQMTAQMTRQINPTLPSNSILNKVSQLIKNTNPNIVRQASPIQRSFMPIDLPFQNVNKKSYGMKIPATNFALPTNIDLVQPSVDGGTFDYYGK